MAQCRAYVWVWRGCEKLNASVASKSGSGNAKSADTTIGRDNERDIFNITVSHDAFRHWNIPLLFHPLFDQPFNCSVLRIRVRKNRRIRCHHHRGYLNHISFPRVLHRKSHVRIEGVAFAITGGNLRYDSIGHARVNQKRVKQVLRCVVRGDGPVRSPR